MSLNFMNPPWKIPAKAYYFLFALLILCFIAFQIDLNSRTDDDYIGEQVYWLMNKGYVKSELMSGFNGIGLENHQTVFHKLWIYNGFVFCSIGGWTLLTLHLASFFYLVLFSILLWWYLKDKYKKQALPIYGFCAFIFLSNYEIKYICLSFRPEIMVMCLGFISYIFLEKFLQKSKIFALLGAGFFAGLAFLTHLNGLIYVVAGFGLLLVNKRWKEAVIFGLLAGFVFSFYFLDIYIHADFSTFWKQLQHDPSLKKGLWSLNTILERIIMEQARYLFTIREIPFTVFFVMVFVFSFKFIKSTQINLLIYLGLLASTLAFWCYTKTPSLLILELPFLAILSFLGFNHIITHRVNFPEWLPKTLIAILVLHCAIDITFSFKKIHENWLALQEPSLQTRNVMLREEIEYFEKTKDLTNKNVLAYGDFIFNEIENFRSIKNASQYVFFIEIHEKPRIYLGELLDSAIKHKIDYLILNKEYESYFDIQNSYKNYPKVIKLIKHENDYWLFKMK